MKAAAEKVMWMGRATVFLVGLAVILALTVGLASAALAGTGVGARFDLGKINAVNQVSRLVGTVAGPSLTVDNNSANGAATALSLQVEAGKAPLKVNSGAKVSNLNADLLDGQSADQFVPAGGKAFDSDSLDGKDSTSFFSGVTYTVRRDEAGPGGGQDKFMAVSCDPGDTVLGGGGGVSPAIFTPVDDGSMTFSRPGSLGSWNVSVQDNGSSSNVFVEGICADFPPLR